jgi:hypothetical protein
MSPKAKEINSKGKKRKMRARFPRDFRRFRAESAFSKMAQTVKRPALFLRQ